MPRRKHPTSLSVQSAIQQQLSQAAHSFAQEILAILRGTTLSDLAVLTGRRLPVSTEEGGGESEGGVPFSPMGMNGRKPPSPKTSAVRRFAGTKPVQCPVDGCTEPGIRSKMNFCHTHASELTKVEKTKLRNIQRQDHQAEVRAAKLRGDEPVEEEVVKPRRGPGRPPGKKSAPKVPEKKPGKKKGARRG